MVVSLVGLLSCGTWRSQFPDQGSNLLLLRWKVTSQPLDGQGSLMGDLLNLYAAAAATKSLQSCPTLCDPIDGSPPGSPVPGILQIRILEWVSISFSNT